MMTKVSERVLLREIVEAGAALAKLPERREAAP